MNENIYLNLAKEYMNKKDYKMALNILIDNLKNIPEDSSYYNIGICLFNLKRYQNAIFAFKLSSKFKRNYLNSLNNIACCYACLHNYKLALKYAYNFKNKLMANEKEYLEVSELINILKSKEKNASNKS